MPFIVEIPNKIKLLLLFVGVMPMGITMDCGCIIILHFHTNHVLIFDGILPSGISLSFQSLYFKLSCSLINPKNIALNETEHFEPISKMFEGQHSYFDM